MVDIRLARVYDWDKHPGDVPAYLVDRLWPRGVSKKQMATAVWPKRLAPDTQLREELHHDELDFADFTTRYVAQLDALLPVDGWTGAERELVEELRRGPVVLLYSARREPPNHASVLRDWLLEHATSNG